MSPKETKIERFRRVAARRTERVLNAIRVLGNCSNKSTYNYTDEEVNKVFSAIDEHLRIVKSRFKTVRRKKFTLS